MEVTELVSAEAIVTLRPHVLVSFKWFAGGSDVETEVTMVYALTVQVQCGE